MDELCFFFQDLSSGFLKWEEGENLVFPQHLIAGAEGKTQGKLSPSFGNLSMSARLVLSPELCAIQDFP